jgi:hypothetical protein
MGLSNQERKTMYSIYRLNANDLDVEFVEGLKTLFKDKEIEIAVYEVDETDYLTRSEAKKKIIGGHQECRTEGPSR